MREHYCITLTPQDDKMGNYITLFIHHMISLHPQKDGTCVVEMAKGEFHVRESEETIISKAKGHNVIIKVGQS